MEQKISKVEIDLLNAAIDRIVSQEVLEDESLGILPKIDELNDSNKVYSGKMSVLFVDMRESTKLPEQYNKKQLVQIYRSYIRVVVQAIRYSGGVVRDFMGDGVLALFIDDENGKSEEKAVHAARYITTAIDKFLNPALDKKINHRISCGIGIHTGKIAISKVGMRGKEQDENSENEFGIAWIGNSTNLACKQSAAVECGTIFISASTYTELSEDDKSIKWIKTEIKKGSNILKGYISKKYYLLLDEDVEACGAISRHNVQSSVDILNEKINEIEKKAESLGAKQCQLKQKSELLYQFESKLNEREEELREKEYSFYCNVVGSGHCKTEYVKAMGQDFWEKNLNHAISAGESIGKTEKDVKYELSYAMVSIYDGLEIYDKAYEYLVKQAEGHSWLILSIVQKIVKQVGYGMRLKTAINCRINKGNLSYKNITEFKKIQKWLLDNDY